MNNLLKQPLKTFTVVGACLAIILSANVNAYDANGAHTSVVKQETKAKQHHKKNRGHMKAIAKVLGLSEEQKVQMKSIKESALNENKALIEQLKAFKTKERALVQSNVFDEGVYIALLDEYQSIRSQLSLNKAKNKHASRQVLTEEQKVKLDKIKHSKSAL